mgnify:CR=1 FL=1
MFQGAPARLLEDGDIIDLGGRQVEVLHTPGHSPGHMCFFERERGYLFTGDLVYKDVLGAPQIKKTVYHVKFLSNPDAEVSVVKLTAAVMEEAPGLPHAGPLPGPHVLL